MLHSNAFYNRTPTTSIDSLDFDVIHKFPVNVDYYNLYIDKYYCQMSLLQHNQLFHGLDTDSVLLCLHASKLYLKLEQRKRKQGCEGLQTSESIWSVKDIQVINEGFTVM